MLHIITSSNGQFITNFDGLPLLISFEDGCTEHTKQIFSSITRFDFGEYKRYYNTENAPEHLDILDIGYWYADGYEQPVESWREELRNNEI